MPAPLRSIDAEEYAVLRRELLPAGGVLQEGRSLAHLASMAGLWAGEGMLLAATVEGDTLRVQELLGEGEPAAITAALGCIKGKFRMPGGQEPFAMYCPLVPEARKPAYSGLAFD